MCNYLFIYTCSISSLLYNIVFTIIILSNKSTGIPWADIMFVPTNLKNYIYIYIFYIFNERNNLSILIHLFIFVC